MNHVAMHQPHPVYAQAPAPIRNDAAPQFPRLAPPVAQRPMPRLPRLQAPPVPLPAAPVAYLDVAHMMGRPAA